MARRKKTEDVIRDEQTAYEAAQGPAQEPTVQRFTMALAVPLTDQEKVELGDSMREQLDKADDLRATWRGPCRTW